MIKLSLVFSAFILSACATSISPVSTTTILEKGKGFTKDNFSYSEYVEQGYKCKIIAQNMHMVTAKSQKNGYLGCMKTRGYNISSLTPMEIEKRNLMLSEYAALRTPTNTNFFDRIDFTDQAFINDTRACVNVAQKIEGTGYSAPYSPNIVTGAVNSFLSGMSKSNDQRKKRNRYLLNCMFKKGYLLSELSAAERERRMQLVNSKN